MNRFLYKFLIIMLTLLPLPALADSAEKTYLFGLSYGEAEEAVSRALANKGAAEKIASFINGRKNEALFSYSEPLTVEVRGLKFDRISHHWSGNLLAVANGEVITAIPAAGRFDPLAEIPVLKRTIRNSEVIAAEDIELRDMATSQIRGDTVTDLASLVGKSPIYSITASRPIRMHEVSEPPLVKKNSIVQMRFRSPGMEISTSGQAMEDGAKGEIIRVKNLTSKKTVQAMVDDVSSVVITPQGDWRTEIQVKDAQPNVRDLYAKN